MSSTFVTPIICLLRKKSPTIKLNHDENQSSRCRINQRYIERDPTRYTELDVHSEIANLSTGIISECKKSTAYFTSNQELLLLC